MEETPASPIVSASLPAALFRALRPRQWVKNALVLVPLLFTIDQGHVVSDVLRALAAAVVFCALSSAIYLVNDIGDVDQDRLHPKKRLRPLAAGQINVATAWAAAAVLLLGGMVAAIEMGPKFALVSAFYVALTLFYTFSLKHQVLIDVLALAMCYVTRAAAGAVAISVSISPWLLVCTFLGAMLIGLAKRRNELLTLKDAHNHRKILEEYTVPMLDQMIAVVTGCTLMAYILYTVLSPKAGQRPLMMCTIPFVFYGVFRFLYLMHRHGKGGDPSAELVEDRALLVCGLLWPLAPAAAIHWGR